MKNEIDTWENDENKLVANLYESIIIKLKHPEKNYKDQYQIGDFINMRGELVILGLSPYNDKHIFEIINNSAIDKCTYYYADNETKLVDELLSNKNVEYKLVKKFWGTTEDKSLNIRINRDAQVKIINENQFEKYLQLGRSMTGCKSDKNMILEQYNSLTKMDCREITEKVISLKRYHSVENDQQEILNKINIHMIAEEYDVAPSVIFFVVINENGYPIIKVI